MIAAIRSAHKTVEAALSKEDSRDTAVTQADEKLG